MNPGTTHGAFSWSELMTTDPSASAKFYSDIFGWSTEVSMMAMGPYTMATLGGRPVAGMMDPGDPNVPCAWTYYVTVDDVDACMTRAVELGATIVVEPMDIPDVGRFFGLVDPHGAYIAAIKYSYPQMPNAEEPDFVAAFGTHGAFSWFELRTPDVAAAKSFYSDVFGWNIEVADMPGGAYHVIKVGEVAIGGIMPLPEEGIPPHWVSYVTVDNVDSIADAVGKSAGSVVAPPFDIPGVGRVTVFSDEHGAILAAIKYAPMEG